MKRRASTAFAAGLLCLLAPAFTAAGGDGSQSGTSGQVADRPATGVTFNCLHATPTDRDAVYRDLRAAHVGWVRINAKWNNLEVAPGRYAPDALAALDGCVAAARAGGLDVLVVLLGTPAWARTGGTETSPPDDPTTYGTALAHLAARYRGSVSAWEVWNEENSRAFWSGSADQYVALLRAAYAAVEGTNPDALVVFGGTAHVDLDWVRACYAAGAKGYFDVAAVHPYPRRPGRVNVSRTLGALTALRRVMLSHADRRPIWLTEFGWSAASVGASEQAVALRRSFAFIRLLPYVTNAFWFEAKNELASVRPDSWQGGLSLITPESGLTPAYRALQSVER